MKYLIVYRGCGMKMKRTLNVLGYQVLGVIFCVGLFSATPSLAATYYVATNGSNSNSGAENQPFQTINKGVSVLKPGDTLYIKSGTYNEWLDNAIPGGTSWSNPVTVSAYPGHNVILKPSSGNFVINLKGSNSQPWGQYIIINGLVLDGANVSYDAVLITYGTGVPPAHHIRIQNSEIRNATKQGVLVQASSGNNEFINVDIHDNGGNDFEHGLYIKSGNNLIEGCRIYRNAGWGVHIYNGDGSGSAVNNIVRKNKVYDNARAGNRGWGILLGSGSGNLAYNNIVWNNKGGIEINYGGPSNTKVYNNTVFGNNGVGIKISASQNSSVMNNISYQNSGDIVNSGSGTSMGGNITSNPSFVNAAAFDFKVKVGSPAIDGGVGVNGVPDDFSGNSRPQGSGYDAGAYEYGTSVADSTPPNPPTGLKFLSN
jgi:parallel beta-helix repeat protein